jgi:hypothetical protein
MPYSDDSSAQRRTPWNKGKLIGPKPPLRPKHVGYQNSAPDRGANP